MTDETHNPSFHDHELEHEHDSPLGSEDEHHHGPVEDDFYDEPGSATVSEENDAHSESAQEIGGEERKRHPFLGIAVIVGGVLLLGGIGYYQFGGLLHKSSTPAIITQNSDSSPAPEQVASVAPKSAMIPPTAMAPSPTPAPIAAVAQTGTATPDAPPVPVAVPVAQAPLQQAIPTLPQAGAEPTQPSIAATPKVVAASQPTTPIAATHPTTLAPLVNAPAQAAPAATMSAVNDHVSDAHIAQLQNRVDGMQKSLQDMMLKLSEIGDKLNAPSVAPASVAAAPNPQMDDRLNKIEQKLIQIEEHTTAPAIAVHETPSVQPTIHEAARTHHRHVATISHHKTKPSQHVVAAHHKKPPHVAHAAIPWVLRAASADQAWISKDRSSRELRPIHVGDNVPGIGRVKAITEGEKGWSVEGTDGSLR